MPTPSPNEPKDKFISRCIVDLTAEGKQNDEAIAQCISIWNQSKGLDAMSKVQILIPIESLKFETRDGKNIGLAQMLPEGKFKHRIYGDLEFTEKKFDNAIANFKKNIPHKPGELALNFNHNIHGSHHVAAGWFTDLNKANKFLNAEIEFTNDGAKKIQEKEFKFISAELNDNFTDNENKKHGFTVVGGGLTNTPFFNQQNPIAMKFSNDILEEYTEPIKKKTLEINGLKYGLTNEEYTMFEKLMKLLKVEKPEELEAAIVKLQTPPVKKEEPKPGEDKNEAKILELEAANEKLTTDLGVLTTSMKSVTDFTAGLKTTQREKDLNALLKDGYVDAAQIAVLKEKKILEVSDETFKMTIDAYRAGQPNYKKLQTTNGNDDEVDETKPVNKFQKRIDELVKDTAMPDIKAFNDAYEWIFANEPKLAQEYENDQLKTSGSTLQIV